jgi:hypothetical protein
MDAWLTAAAARIVAEAGGEPLALTDAEEAMLLDAARLAAHQSGSRTNAPLLCYLLGVAAGRSGAALGRLSAALDA